jgi:hypothetical protein
VIEVPRVGGRGRVVPQACLWAITAGTAYDASIVYQEQEQNKTLCELVTDADAAVAAAKAAAAKGAV